MKRYQLSILSAFLFLALSVFVFTSCKKDIATNPNVITKVEDTKINPTPKTRTTEIYEDEVYHSLAMDQLWIINNLSTANANNIIENDAINTILSGDGADPLTTTQKTDLAALFNLDSYEDLLTYFESVNTRMEYLDQNYGFFSFTETELNYASSMYDPNSFGDIVLEAPTSSGCKWSYYGCLGIVNGAVAAWQLGCGALDVTIVAGVLCHLSAIAWGVAAGDDCSNSYDACLGVAVGANPPFNGGLTTTYSIALNNNLSCL